MQPPLTLDTIDIIRPERYATRGYPHEDWALLRRDSPVHWIEKDVVNPFWAITRYEDIVWLGKQPKRFLNEPRLAVLPGTGTSGDETDDFARHLLVMDPPDHASYRKVTSGWFTPRAIQRLAPEVERITRDLFDEIAQAGPDGTIDFVGRMTAPLTLSVLADLLGVPREDWPLMFRWTNQVAGPSDPEYRVEGETPFETVNRARIGLFEYFAKLAEARRASPGKDMVSVIANARVDGAPIPPLETLSYYFLLVVAGNETTRNAASGGLLALIENPQELRKLRDDPGLIDSAVEEIVRWTTPVIQFCRTPVEDLELRGQKIRAGESMCLFYPSGNRDEEIFDEPDRFLVDRNPNPHIGFGRGEHFCLGASLARLELRVLFRQLIERFDDVELAGDFERVQSSFLGGVKRMPIRYRLAS